MRLSIRVSVLLAAVLTAGPSVAVAAGDPVAGKALAENWCKSCHLVGPEQTSAVTEAPPFATIAAHYQNQIEALAAFLADPHPPMPNLSLTRQEIQDLLAYIASLK